MSCSSSTNLNSGTFLSKSGVHKNVRCVFQRNVPFHRCMAILFDSLLEWWRQPGTKRDSRQVAVAKWVFPTPAKN